MRIYCIGGTGFTMVKHWFPALLCTILLLSPVRSNEGYSRQEDYSNGEGFDDFVDSSAIETVVEFLGKFETLSASTADVGVFMERISLSAFAFLKLAFPVGSLVAGALNIATKTESDEYKALLKLRDTMEAKFTDMERRITVSEKVIALSSKLHDYINNVHVPAENIRQQVDLFWNPAVDKTSGQVSDFKRVCYRPYQSEGTPLGILNYIYAHCVKHCQIGLSPRQISLLAHLFHLLRKIRMQLSSERAKEEFDESASELSIWFTELDSGVANRVLEKIEVSIDPASTFESAQDAMHKVKSFLLENVTEPRQNSMCLLQDIITGKNYHHKAIEELENIIRIDVLQMMVFASICSNITFGESPTSMLWYQNVVFKRVKDIVDHVQLYTATELEKSFPTIEKAVVKSTIDEMRLVAPVTDNATITKAMFSVFNAVNEVGNRKYIRQGIVSANIANETDFVMRCAAENCFSLLDYNGLHTIVTRFNTDKDEERAIKTFEWFYFKSCPCGGIVHDLLKQIIDINFNINKVSDLLKKIETTYFNLTNEEYYRNVVILRNYGPEYQCGISAAAYVYTLEAYEACGKVKYYYPGSFWYACEAYALYLFT